MDAIQNKIRGSLIGGAIGDALGYPVEFIFSFDGIQQRYGENGITRFDKSHYWEDDEVSDKAVVSDDTQMTLFTANGLFNAKRLGIKPEFAICQAYTEWLQTQKGKLRGKADCWVRDLPEMNARRAPGATCISALEYICKGKDPHNNSKGCGGLMRIAPIPLYAATQARMSIKEADRLAAYAAKITHQQPLGYIPAALDSHVLYSLLEEERPLQDNIIAAINDGIDEIKTTYRLYPDEVKKMSDLAEKAIALATDSKAPDVENIGELGEGWTAEDNLAIALYCSIKYNDNFEKAIVASVNHKGDSDSTGAVTGNIIGTITGYDAIPDYYKVDLELHEVILHMADDLYSGSLSQYYKSGSEMKMQNLKQP